MILAICLTLGGELRLHLAGEGTMVRLPLPSAHTGETGPRRVKKQTGFDSGSVEIPE